MSRVDPVKAFYKGKAQPKKRALFDYDPDGNMIERNKEGAVIHTHPLPTYRAPTLDEYKELEEARKAAVAEATDAYQAARYELHQAFQGQRKSPLDILELNKRVQDADIALQKARFPLVCVDKLEGVTIRDLDFNQPNEIRKLTYPISIMYRHPYGLQQQYVRAEESEEKPLISLAEVKRSRKVAKPVILFSDIDYANKPYGFLSLNYPVDIEIQGETYRSARHALYALLATDFNDMESLDRILETEKPEALFYSVDATPGGKEANQEKWVQGLQKWIPIITKAKFESPNQSELALRLEQTHPALLGAYEPDDTVIGIGIALDKEDAKQEKKWPPAGNLLGKALMEVREELRSKRPAPSPLLDAVKSRKKTVSAKVASEAPITVSTTSTGKPLETITGLEEEKGEEKPQTILDRAKSKIQKVQFAEKVEPSEATVLSSAVPKMLQNAKSRIKGQTIARVPRAAMAASAAPVAAPVAVPVAAPVAAPGAAPVAAPVAAPAPPSGAPTAIRRPRRLGAPSVVPQAAPPS